MTRRSNVQDPVTLELIPKEEYRARRQQPAGPAVFGDLKPYRNVIDWQPIDGRKAHREFLARHGVEVRDDTPAWMKERAYNDRYRDPTARKR